MSNFVVLIANAENFTPSPVAAVEPVTIVETGTLVEDVPKQQSAVQKALEAKMLERAIKKAKADEAVKAMLERPSGTAEEAPKTSSTANGTLKSFSLERDLKAEIMTSFDDC